MNITSDEYLPLSGIQHFAFCQRQWALIHLEKQWRENHLTAEGRLQHEHVHEPGQDKRPGVILARGMPVFSAVLGIQGVCDMVEFRRDDNLGVTLAERSGKYVPVPVEYKRGSPKNEDADKLQVCAQAMCLEEMLACEVAEGYLFYWEIRRRQHVLFDDSLRKQVVDVCQMMHAYFERGHTPMVRRKAACRSCSMQDICLPTLVHHEKASVYLKSKLTEADNG